MRQVLLHRSPSSDQGTRGILVTDGDWWCHTLELPWRENATNVSCIPDGEYECLYVQIKNPIGGRNELYWLRNTPGRTGILLHAGTFAGNRDLGYRTNVLGCLLLGYAAGVHRRQQAIFQSRAAVCDFINHMQKEPFKLIIRGLDNGISH